MNDIYLTFNAQNELTHITYFSVVNTKSTVDVTELPDDVKNVYIADYKKQKTLARYDRYLNLISYDTSDFAEPDTTYDNQPRFNTHKYFDVALKQLTPDHQFIIHEHFFHNTTVTELARQLNVSKPAISQRLTRAKNALKKILAQYDCFNYLNDSYDFDNAA